MVIFRERRKRRGKTGRPREDRSIGINVIMVGNGHEAKTIARGGAGEPGDAPPPGEERGRTIHSYRNN